MGFRNFVKPAGFLFLALAPIPSAFGAAKVTGELKQWHKVSLDVEGPASGETATPNPFTDYRLQVEFTGPAGQKYSVPGYFAADGNAGESSAAAGNVWRAHLAPDQVGKWSFTISFRTGPKVAVTGTATTGTAVAGDGETGEFTVAASDKAGRDFRGKGTLRYVNKHHLQFAGSREYFLKAGADSPENMLGYADFDGTSKEDGGALKTWAPHVKDWQEGDPSWKGGKGKGLIGALNYLAGKGMNVFSFLTLNIDGDGKDAWMYTGYAVRDRFDCSKLDQWEIVFSHGDKLGLYLHFKTQEIENYNLLDGGNLGDFRKLYYRELIARFSHHLALNWNLGEENRQTAAQVKDMCAYFHANDPYRHNIVLHTFPGEQNRYTPLLGTASELTGVSIQTGWDAVYAETKEWVQASAASGKPWIVANDEQNGANQGVAADAAYTGNRGTVADNREGIRQQTLWGNILAGGAGVEYYFGYETGETDLTLQDFRSRETKWDDARHALEFFAKNPVPFWDMAPSTASSLGWTLAKPGDHYLVYLPAGGSPTLNLASTPGNFTAKWYNPRTGTFDREGPITGGPQVSLGQGPAGGDWLIWIYRDGVVSALPGVSTTRGLAGRAAAFPVQADGRKVDNPRRGVTFGKK